MSRGFLVAVLSLLPFVAVAAPVPKFKESPARKLVRLFGDPTLPDDTCKAELRDDALRLTGGADEHVWHAGAGGMKVPFTSREVAGDFTATVTVRAVDLPETGSVTGVAGLLVLKDAETALDHSLYLTGDRATASRRGWLRAVAAGNQVSTKEDQNAAFADDAVRLKVQRAGTTVTAFVAGVGKAWTEIDRFEMDLDKTAKVGLFVAHTGGSFTAEFRDFTVTTK